MESIFNQVHLPDEIIIADDGSGPATKELIELMQRNSPRPMVHIWHEDHGYRLASIRNRSFAAARSEYLIQIDGDLLLEKHFIADHLSIAKAGTFVAGARAMMNEALTKNVLEGNLKIEELAEHRAEIDKRHNAMRSDLLKKISYFWQQNNFNYKYVFGCNMAFWKEDLLKVNGYDESFKGWGKEDNELAVRLLNAGVKIRFLKFGGVAYHMHHKVADLSSMDSNEERLMESIRKKSNYATDGLNNYLK